MYQIHMAGWVEMLPSGRRSSSPLKNLSVFILSPIVPDTSRYPSWGHVLVKAILVPGERNPLKLKGNQAMKMILGLIVLLILDRTTIC